MMWKAKKTFVLVAAALTLLSGCEWRRWMYDNARIKPLEENCFFADCRSSRPLVEGTVARGQLQEDDLLYRGMENGRMATRFPFAIEEEEMAKGREQYDIYCSVCHGHAGYGDGMIVQRGYKTPPSFHLQRLRDAEPGYFFTVMTNGFGTMPSYESMISAENRWKIAAYIQALQLSQNAQTGDVPEEERDKLNGGAQ